MATSFTLLEVGCKEKILIFLIQNFKLEKLELQWMYDPIGEFTIIVKVNKKFLVFNHEAQPHIEYFSNQTKKKFEASPEWDICILDKAWMSLEGVKKYRLWETKRQEFTLAPKLIA